MNTRIGGLMALLVVGVLAILGMVSGVSNRGDSHIPHAVGDNEVGGEIRMNQSNIPLATLLYVGFGFVWNEHRVSDDDAYWVPKPAGHHGMGTRGWNVIGDTFYEGLTFGQPAIGWYASEEESTIAWQLEQMQRAGISVIFISWQGWGDDDLDGVVSEGSIAAAYDRTAKAILDYIQVHKLPFQFGILVEDFPADLGNTRLQDISTDQRLMVINHLWDRFFDPNNEEAYADIAFRWNGKPLVFGGAHEPGWWWENDENFDQDKFVLMEVYNKPEDEGEHLASAIYTPPPAKLPGHDGISILWPRHEGLLPLFAQNAPWVNLETVRRVDPFGTEGAYDRAWKEIIEYAPRTDIKLIWLWSWNAHSEMTYIEPDSGLGPYGVGDLYVRKTAHYYNLFKSGRHFKEYVPNWVPLEQFTPTIGNVSHQDLGLSSEYEKDALLRRLLRQAQDWIVQYTRRTFSGPEQNVVGWLDESWTGEGYRKDRIRVAPYRNVVPGTVIQIGDGEGFEPAEFAQVKTVAQYGGNEVWELAHPLKRSRRDGEPILEVVVGGTYGIGEVPPSIKEANIRLAGNMWHYIVHTPKGRLMDFENIGVTQIDDSIFTDGIKKDLDLWKRRGKTRVYSP